jgi:hypothetical protein
VLYKHRVDYCTHNPSSPPAVQVMPADIAQAKAESRRETGRHSDQQRILAKYFEEIGVAGEDRFEDEAGLRPVPKRSAYGGDRGYDFLTADGIKVDVKTVGVSRHMDYHLLVEKEKVDHADLYVLAWCDVHALVRLLGQGRNGAGSVELIGWATQLEVERAPVKRLRDDGHVNRALRRSVLGDMRSFWRHVGITPRPWVERPR